MELGQGMAGEMSAAILRGDARSVRRLLDAGCDPGINIGPSPAVVHLPFQVAAAHLKVDVCKVLLDYGVDPNVSSSETRAPLLEVVQNYTNAAVRDYLAELLLERGADPNLYLPARGPGATPMHAVLSNPTVAAILPLLKLMVRHGGDVNFMPEQPSEAYLTPFQYEVSNFHELSKLRFLLFECDTDPFQKTIGGRSMLQLAQSGKEAARRKELIKEAQVLWRSRISQRAVESAVAGAAGGGSLRTENTPVSRRTDFAL
jgi:hypothetical protein